MRTPRYVGKPLPDAVVEYECDQGYTVRGVFPKQPGSVLVDIRCPAGTSMLAVSAPVSHVASIGPTWPIFMKTSARTAMLREGVSERVAGMVAEAVRVVCDLPFGGAGSFTDVDPVRGRCVTR